MIQQTVQFGHISALMSYAIILCISFVGFRGWLTLNTLMLTSSLNSYFFGIDSRLVVIFVWIASRQLLLFHPPKKNRNIVMSVFVCLCVYVCLSAIISSELHVRSSPTFFVHVNCGRGSVLL